MTPLSDAITAALLRSLWQDALIAALLAAVLAVLRVRSPNARYLACCAALALMAALPAWTAVATYRQLSSVPVVVDGVSAGAGTPPPVYSRETAARPIETPAPSGWQAQVVPAAYAWALPLWMAGVLLFSIRGVCAGTQASALRRRCAPADEATTAMVARLASRLGIQRQVRVLRAGIAEGPAMVGWLRPVILLPPAAALGLTTQQLEALLTHELAHVRRHDYLVNVAQMIAETLFFYHPAIWYASRRIRLERELCCDDIVVAGCGDAVEYARALACVARVRVRAADLALAAGGGSLLHRIQRLIQPQCAARRMASRWPTSRWPAITTLLLVLAAATMIFPYTTMAGFARTLTTMQGMLGRPVIDRTGLTENYSINLTFAGVDTADSRGPAGSPPTPASDAPSIFTALQEQLGLRLNAAEGPNQFIVIESIERPTPD